MTGMYRLGVNMVLGSMTVGRVNVRINLVIIDFLNSQLTSEPVNGESMLILGLCNPIPQTFLR